MYQTLHDSTEFPMMRGSKYDFFYLRVNICTFYSARAKKIIPWSIDAPRDPVEQIFFYGMNLGPIDKKTDPVEENLLPVLGIFIDWM